MVLVDMRFDEKVYWVFPPDMVKIAELGYYFICQGTTIDNRSAMVRFADAHVVDELFHEHGIDVTDPLADR